LTCPKAQFGGGKKGKSLDFLKIAIMPSQTTLFLAKGKKPQTGITVWGTGPLGWKSYSRSQVSSRRKTYQVLWRKIDSPNFLGVRIESEIINLSLTKEGNSLQRRDGRGVQTRVETRSKLRGGKGGSGRSGGREENHKRKPANTKGKKESVIDIEIKGEGCTRNGR